MVAAAQTVQTGGTAVIEPLSEVGSKFTSSDESLQTKKLKSDDKSNSDTKEPNQSGIADRKKVKGRPPKDETRPLFFTQQKRVTCRQFSVYMEPVDHEALLDYVNFTESFGGGLNISRQEFEAAVMAMALAKLLDSDKSYKKYRADLSKFEIKNAETEKIQ